MMSMKIGTNNKWKKYKNYSALKLFREADPNWLKMFKNNFRFSSDPFFRPVSMPNFFDFPTRYEYSCQFSLKSNDIIFWRFSTILPYNSIKFLFHPVSMGTRCIFHSKIYLLNVQANAVLNMSAHSHT